MLNRMATVTCADGSPGYTVTATRKACVWTSCPGSGNPELVCD